VSLAPLLRFLRSSSPKAMFWLLFVSMECLEISSIRLTSSDGSLSILLLEKWNEFLSLAPSNDAVFCSFGAFSSRFLSSRITHRFSSELSLSKAVEQFSKDDAKVMINSIWKRTTKSCQV
jgi:hypothetical protein